MPQIKQHIDEPDIPTDLTERKRWLSQLYDHRIWEYGEPAYSDVERLLSIRPVYVSDRGHVEDDESLNTHFEVWIEAGPMVDNSKGDMPEPRGGWHRGNRWTRGHDIRLDCGGETMEEALLILYARIQTFYHEDGTSDGRWWCSEAKCQNPEGSFCTTCGFLIEPG